MSADLGWVAGFMDGEGCIVVGANGSLQLRIINTSLKSLERVRETLKTGTIKSRKQKVNKAQYYWSCYGADAANALVILMPHLTAKNAQAFVAVNYYTLTKSWPKYRENVEKRLNLVNETRAKLTELKQYD